METSSHKELAEPHQVEPWSCGSFAGGTVQRAPQDDQLGPGSIAIANAVGILDQPREYGSRIVRRDLSGAMPEEILAIL